MSARIAGGFRRTELLNRWRDGRLLSAPDAEAARRGKVLPKADKPLHVGVAAIGGRLPFPGLKMGRGRKAACFLLFALTLTLALIFGGTPAALAASGDNADAAAELSEVVNGQLSDLDLFGFESYLAALEADEYSLFGGMSFTEKLRGVINGDFKIGYDSFFSAFMGLIFGKLVNFLPILAAIIGVAILYSLIYNARPDSGGGGTGKIIYFACFGVIAVIVAAALTQVIALTRGTLLAMQKQMNIAFPVLLTLMTAMGGSASAAVYQPAVALLAQVVSGVMINVVLPIFLFTLVFNILGSLTDGIKLGKMTSFFSGLNKWIIGIVFTGFSAFLSIQGITAATHDSVSLRTAKFAISNYVPIIGGYLSDGFNLIIAGSVLIKNAVGFSAILLLVISVMKPIASILVLSLGLKLTAAVLEPIADSKLSGFLEATGKSLNMLIAMILAVAFMYFITLLLIVCTGNYLLT